MINFKSNRIAEQQSNRNHMKMQKSIIFVKKDLKIKMLKIKNNVKLGTIVIMQVNIDMLHIAYVI